MGNAYELQKSWSRAYIIIKDYKVESLVMQVRMIEERIRKRPRYMYNFLLA